MKHRRKFKDEQVITLQMSQELKTKNINVVPGQLFCCQYEAKFLLETDLLNLLQILIMNSLNVSNSKKKAPINWHFTCQITRIYENFKEQYFRSIQSAS